MSFISFQSPGSSGFGQDICSILKTVKKHVKKLHLSFYLLYTTILTIVSQNCLDTADIAIKKWQRSLSHAEMPKCGVAKLIHNVLFLEWFATYFQQD